MKKLIKAIIRKIFHRNSNSECRTFWVNHIHDETVTWPNKALMWANVHGFDQGPGETYWLGLDLRSFGIRCADYLLKFRDKSLYDEYLDAALRDTEKILYKMRSDPRLNYTYGNDMDVEFYFKWGGEEKSFHIHLGIDSYAEQRT